MVDFIAASASQRLRQECDVVTHQTVASRNTEPTTNANDTFTGGKTNVFWSFIMMIALF